MKRIRYGYFLTIFGTILLLNFVFFALAFAQDLHMAPAKENVHPKMASCLKKLEVEHEKSPMAGRLFAQGRNIKIKDHNNVTVYLMNEPGTSIDETSLQALGGKIIKSAGNVSKVKAPINMLTAIADNVRGVSFIKLPDRLIPANVSEGVGLTGASSYHTAGYDGSGVNVAVIDVGFDRLTDAINNFELPNNVVKIDFTSEPETEEHGTAVAEIVYDMAPGAKLYLLRIYDTLDLWDAEDYAINHGIKIINHSLVVFNTNFYDGECYNSNPVCTANHAYNHGILWVNAAGNQSKRHYQATFTDLNSNEWHDVSVGDETINITAGAGQTIDVYLTWDAWPATNQDYNLYLYNSSSALVASSENSQTGTQEPIEDISYTVPLDGAGIYDLRIKKISATSNHKLEVYSLSHTLTPAIASSSLPNPADADGAMAVSAIDYSNWPNWPIGPQEPSSSQGPTNDGRIKPDICGPDNVLNYTFGRFSGTSAASPHVAGAAALILDKYPGYSVFELWNALTSSAIDMGDPGKDNIYGCGRLNLGGGGNNTCIRTDEFLDDGSTRSSSSGGGGGGGCFIATAAYGSPMEPHVKILRVMRDRFLLTNGPGRTLVNFYYTYSPATANFIAGHAGLRRIVRVGLLPLVGVSRLALKMGLVPTIGFMLLSGICLIVLVRFKNVKDIQ
ncbi:MAG: S8 family serine peptidase [Deltaproteobacteria bacterium]|nr:S8 family serine peptidase [Deltaproteobacteria bacterium]